MSHSQRIAAIGLIALSVGALAPSVAQACDMAEKLRLAEEQKKLVPVPVVK